MSYYVYIYLDPRKPEAFEAEGFHFDHTPIYVGKGTYAKRAYQHLGEKGRTLKVNTIQKILALGLNPIIHKLKYFNTNDEAMELEIALIASLGTQLEVVGVKRGPLTNMTRGGEGVSGRKHSENAMEIYKDRKGEKNPFFGKHHTEEHKLERSLKYSGVNHPCYGTSMSEETKQRISDAKKGCLAWNKGASLSDEDKKKVSDATKIAMARPEVKQKIKDALSGRKRILKDGKRKNVKPEDLPIYLNDGWQLAVSSVSSQSI